MNGKVFLIRSRLLGSKICKTRTICVQLARLYLRPCASLVYARHGAQLESSRRMPCAGTACQTRLSYGRTSTHPLEATGESRIYEIQIDLMHKLA